MVSGPKSCSLKSIQSLNRQELGALKKAGIDNTKELLAATRSQADQQALAARTGVSSGQLSEAVHRADLLQVSGIGAKSADLFENAGIESASLLAQKNADSIRALLVDYAAKHPEMKVRLPSPKTIGSLVEKARQIAGATPAEPAAVDAAGAKKLACEALHAHIDEVLFGVHPDGANFREAVLGWRPESEWPKVQEKFHAAVDAWGQGAECGTDEQIPGSFWFSGSLSDLYTEVKVGKAGELLKVYVEID